MHKARDLYFLFLSISDLTATSLYKVTTAEAIDVARMLAREEGLLVKFSALNDFFLEDPILQHNKRMLLLVVSRSFDFLCII